MWASVSLTASYAKLRFLLLLLSLLPLLLLLLEGPLLSAVDAVLPGVGSIARLVQLLVLSLLLALKVLLLPVVGEEEGWRRRSTAAESPKLATTREVPLLQTRAQTAVVPE